MLWRAVDEMSLRLDLVTLACQAGANRAELCRRFGVSRKTGYKWLERFAEAGAAGLVDRSRRPHGSPLRTGDAVERAVLAAREAHPSWGGRKLRHFLLRGGAVAVPAASTITAILRRHGRLVIEEPASQAYRRFEAAAPNDLWQMDFKGHFALDGRTDGTGVRCWPLAVLDDHSRYLIGGEACANEKEATVRQRLARLFEHYGLPAAIITDNGNPWGQQNRLTRLTRLSVWLIRLGIRPLWSRPRHPQTMGKIERLNRTLKVELLQGRRFGDFAAIQAGLDAWRRHYNHDRPHDALDGAVPASRYRMSRRAMPATLPEPAYLEDDRVGRIRQNGCLRCRPHGQSRVDLQLSIAFAGQLAAIRPSVDDGVFHVWFSRYRIAEVDFRANPQRPAVTHLFEHLSPFNTVHTGTQFPRPSRPGCRI